MSLTFILKCTTYHYLIESVVKLFIHCQIIFLIFLGDAKRSKEKEENDHGTHWAFDDNNDYILAEESESFFQFQ